MMEQKELTRTDGTKFSIPIFLLENRKINFVIAVLGIDFDKEGRDWNFGDDKEVMYCNKLNDALYLGEVIPAKFLFSIPEWDYLRYPNPEIVILKPKGKIISLKEHSLFAGAKNAVN